MANEANKMENNQKLRSRQPDRYEYIIKNIKDVIWEMNTEFIFTFLSPNVKDMTGYEVDEVIGRKLTDFLNEESAKYFNSQLMQNVNKRINGNMSKAILYDVQFVCKNGSVKWLEVSANIMLEESKFIGYIGTSRDISEKKEYEYQISQYIQKLKVINAELKKTAVTDILTGAYNRRKFEDDLNLIINDKKKTDMGFSLIIFDIDYFKNINDQYGHKTGDFVLQHVSELIFKSIRMTDRLFRWGGDEFILVLPDTNLEGAKYVAEKIRNIIQNEDFGIEMKITISSGVSEYTANEDPDQLISRIDKILYQAKIRGRNRVESELVELKRIV